MTNLSLNNNEFLVLTRKQKRLLELEKRKKRRKKRIAKFFLLLILLFSCYISVAFLDLPYIKDLRNIYIETAMTTADHKWLATLFFPDKLIKKVMSSKVTNSKIISVTKINSSEQNSAPIKNDILRQGNLQVGDLDYAGNEIFINDIDQGILISKVKGKTFEGKVALIDDPSRVFIGFTDKKGKQGRYILDYLDMYDSILGINASGFNDPNGKGSGGSVVGLTYSNGESWGKYTKIYGVVAFDKNNRLVVGAIDDWDKYNIRDGAQFSPALIVNGEKIIKGSAGWGLQPRTIVGQREDGVVIFLIIDGRQPGHSLGATMEDCANVMLSYCAVTAGACDGGSSSIMTYDGNIITKCSSPSKVGRLLPNAFLVKRK
ncbi:Exopolysaccharide biosynthesis protein [Caloramator quimbayensis]|uniref:Exopolysaccharide biosynthesis protein n=1 Tax=Caloramator quimbayensis TaxID=1147123 RepID=A0A1T4WQQ8_9CLOT|nr:phosphodiester glycosidase family protein [Caloramator quimbayensis]SKA79447.1 Exopolysaccharide biosynthesis protein [Caloramator quimbayensis]